MHKSDFLELIGYQVIDEKSSLKIYFYFQRRFRDLDYTDDPLLLFLVAPLILSRYLVLPFIFLRIREIAYSIGHSSIVFGPV
jgi:hypothetical protein